MGDGMAGLRLAVLGGDDREAILVRELVGMGSRVTVAGFPPREELQGARLVDGVAEALEGAQAVVLPMPGTDDQGCIRAVYAQRKLYLTEEIAARLLPGLPVFIGVARPYLREWSRRYGFQLTEIAELDDVAILNSIPSAEGAIQMAMEALPITLHGSNAVVLGFGRVGQTLARMLAGLGAHTAVVARKSRDLARGYEQGYATYRFEELLQALRAADVVFNTVPALILREEELRCLPRTAVVIDLASQPGGTDFQAAERLGLKAILAPGLPGKVAPVTAGLILARVLPPLIQAALATS